MIIPCYFPVDGYSNILGASDLLQDRVAADYFLLPSVGDSDNLSQSNSINQSASDFCNLSMSSCNLSASADALIFRYRRQSSASRRSAEDIWSGGSLVEENGTENCALFNA